MEPRPKCPPRAIDLRDRKGDGAVMATFDFVGYVASILVLLMFLSKNMQHLRVIATLSNIAFATYGARSWLPPVLCLHLVLLPVNILRLSEVTKTEPRGGVRIARRAVEVNPSTTVRSL